MLRNKNRKETEWWMQNVIEQVESVYTVKIYLSKFQSTNLKIDVGTEEIMTHPGNVKMSDQWIHIHLLVFRCNFNHWAEISLGLSLSFRAETGEGVWIHLEPTCWGLHGCCASFDLRSFCSCVCPPCICLHLWACVCLCTAWILIRAFLWDLTVALKKPESPDGRRQSRPLQTFCATESAGLFVRVSRAAAWT